MTRTIRSLLLAALAASPATAHGQATFGDQLAATPAPVTVYVARRIHTLEPANPTATAVAVSGKQVVAAGSLDEVKRALGDRTYVVDETFRSRVILPGLIDQHLHPLLGALCLSTEVIAPEEWVLPGRTFQAATTPAGHLARLRAAEVAMKDKDGWLFSWGYHQLWHGKLDRKTLDGTADYAIVAFYPGRDAARKQSLTGKVVFLPKTVENADMFVAFSKKSKCLGALKAGFAKALKTQVDGGKVNELLDAADQAIGIQ